MKPQERKATEAQILLRDHLLELKAFHPSEIVSEYKFWPDRKWRFDLAIPHLRLAFEANGGKWHGGHRRGNAIEDENDKINSAQMNGWRVLQFTNEQIMDERAKLFIAEHLGAVK